MHLSNVPEEPDSGRKAEARKLFLVFDGVSPEGGPVFSFEASRNKTIEARPHAASLGDLVTTYSGRRKSDRNIAAFQLGGLRNH
jgi:hypothetical protein